MANNPVLDVIDFMDTPLWDTSVAGLPGSGDSPQQVVASLADDVKRVRVADTTGKFVGVYTGAASSEVLQFIINPGMDGEMPVKMAKGERVSLRNMEGDAISVGNLCLQFLK